RGGARPAGRDVPDGLHGGGARPALADAGRSWSRGTHRQPRPGWHLHGARTRRAPRRGAAPGGDRGRRADGALPAGPPYRRGDGRAGPHRGAPARASRRAARHGVGGPVRASGERLPLLGRRREADPGHAGGSRIRMRARAAVFCLHDIVPHERLAEVGATHRPYALSPAEFRAHLMAASGVGRSTITAGQIPGELAARFFCLTFDDGCASDYSEAFPALLELRMRATFFVVPTMVGTAGYVSWPELREMAAAGMEIGSHSLTHPFLHELDAAGVRREFGESKRILEDR